MPSEESLARRLLGIPAQVDADADLLRRGNFVSVACLWAIGPRSFHVSVVAGRIAALEPGPILMRSWCFAIRGTAQAWQEFWQPMPAPGWHDLFALTKRGALTLEGDLQPLIANLQYFKDVLALPRRAAVD